MGNTVAVVYHSGYGHTKALAEAVREGAAGVEGTEAPLIAVDAMTDADWDVLDGADAIVFGAPTYMGSASAPFKSFMDQTSKRWAEQRWKNKLAAGFTNSGSFSGDKLTTLHQFINLAGQHGMVWVSLGLMPAGSAEDLNRVGGFVGAMAQSNVDEGADVAPPATDRATGAHLGRRVATMALSWNPPTDI